MKTEEHMEKSQGRRPSDNRFVRKTVRQPSAKKTENSGGAGAYTAEKKKTTHDTICPVDHINHCSNCRNHFVETFTAHQKEQYDMKEILWDRKGWTGWYHGG